MQSLKSEGIDKFSFLKCFILGDFAHFVLQMDDIRNDVTINKTGALVWGRKRLQHVVLK